MIERDQDDFIEAILGQFDITKRKTKGQDHSKNYHKITISLSEKDKESIAAYAQKHNIKVSELIREALKEKGILN
nr:DUF6290 family protein [Sulfurospirillum sp. 'SP']